MHVLSFILYILFFLKGQKYIRNMVEIAASGATQIEKDIQEAQDLVLDPDWQKLPLDGLLI